MNWYIERGKRVTAGLICAAIAAYAANKGVAVPAEATEAFVLAALNGIATVLVIWSKLKAGK